MTSLPIVFPDSISISRCGERRLTAIAHKARTKKHRPLHEVWFVALCISPGAKRTFLGALCTQYLSFA